MIMSYSRLSYSPACVVTLSLSAAAMTLSWSTLSAAQDPPAKSSVAASPTSSGAETAEIPVWKQAMTLYELGQVDDSLAMLRKQVLACGDAGTPACEDSERAALYMCVGIVLSGGQSNHNGGVQAFKKALTLDETMRVAPEYSTAPVQKAFAEARGVQAEVPAPVTPPMAAEVPPPQAEEEEEDDEPPYDPNKSRLFILAGGGFKYGFIGQNYYEDYYDGYDGSLSLTQLGGSVAFGGMPGDTSGFTLGARMRGGALFARDTFGYVGGHMFLGGTMGPRVNNRFFFIGGGAGFESYPALERSALTGHFMAAGSLGGFMLSGGVDVALSDRLAYIIFGIEVGYGGLL